MRARKLRTIAKRWWPSDGGDQAYRRVSQITWDRHDQLPELLRMLARTAPQGGLSYLGTVLVEDLIYQAEDLHSLDRVAPLVLSARLEQAQVFEILTGVHPRLLNLIDVRTAFRGVLSEAQLEWLLDSDRSSVKGTPVADGDGVAVIPGVSEWERLHLRPATLPG